MKRPSSGSHQSSPQAKREKQESKKVESKAKPKESVRVTNIRLISFIMEGIIEQETWRKKELKQIKCCISTIVFPASALAFAYHPSLSFT